MYNTPLMTSWRKLTLEDLKTKRHIYEEYTSSNQETLRELIKDDIYSSNVENTPVYKVHSILPRNEFERNILNACKTNKSDFLKISQEKSKIAEFDKKMKRIKKIKSRKYRKHLKIARNKNDNSFQVPDFLIENIDEQKKAKAFHDEEMAQKVGKIMKIDTKDSSSDEDSECDLLKDDGSYPKASTLDLTDDHLSLFKQEKKEIIENDKPKNQMHVLPGWGVWGGRNLQTIQTPVNTIQTHSDGVASKKRKDFGLSRVIIKEETLKNNIKVELPFGFTKTEYEAWLNIPVSKQAYSHKIFSRFIRNDGKEKNDNVEIVHYRSNIDYNQ